MAISIDQRYDDLLSLSTINPQSVINESHTSTSDVRSAIIVILRAEYSAAVFNAWGLNHGIPYTLPE